MVPLEQISPFAIEHPEVPVPIEHFRLRFLAQGDSWFSFGALPPMGTANLFLRIMLPESTCVVNCAHPGEALRRMTDTTRQPVFLQLLSGARRRPWDGLLLSGGGNDVIEALEAGPEHPLERRLLRRRDEWGAVETGPERYLSEAGWQALAVHLTAVFDQLIVERDRHAENRDIPVVLHTYDFATPRNAPAGPFQGPWLLPALQAFEVPSPDWVGLSRALQTRLAQLLTSFALRHTHVHVVDTLGRLIPASITDTLSTVHWANEIHPSTVGYARLGKSWAEVLNRVYADRWQVRP